MQWIQAYLQSLTAATAQFTVSQLQQGLLCYLRLTATATETETNGEQVQQKYK